MTSSMCLVEIEGSPLPDDLVPLLISAMVEDSQRLPDMFALRFRDPERIVLSKSNAKVGSKIKIKVNTATSSSPATLIEAEITALELEFDTGGTFTVIRGYDPAHRLFRDRRTVSYVQMTASDIASQVAKRAGLKVGKVDSTSTVFPFVSQAGQTDWEILTQLARDAGSDLTVRNGQFSFVKQTEDAASGTPPTLKFGEELLRFRSVITSAQQVGKVEVRGWNVAEKNALVATAPAKTSAVDLPTVKPTDLANAFGNPTYVSTDIPYRTQSEVDQAAKALAEEKAAAFAEFEGVARGNPDLKAGKKVTLDGLGAPFEGKYTITSSRHRFDPTTGYTTAITVTGKQDRSLLGLASGGARSRNTPGGVVIAQVTDAKDPDKMGRVKVKYPWLSDDYVSGWARVVCPGGGKERGWIALPEVGDEVLVAFEQQDFDRPVVFGGLYNGIDKLPPGPNDLVDGGSGAINRRSLVSRAGHRIDLLDEEGKKEGISITTKDEKFLINIDKTNTMITVHADGKVLIEGTQGITLDAKTSDLTMKAGSIKMNATQGVQVDGGSGSVQMKSNGSVSVEGMSVSVKGQTTASVEGSAMTTIKGGMVKIN
ncbi:VgrG-related protein [Microlunatus ginsengisoli]|uniref:VgrG-related protein n=1 Tax=Microlunatus ginsengisoli TaxID=363863 RepID=A0ABP7AQZ8_9ACTN